MSTTSVTYPIVAALKTAERILGPDRAWNPANETQRRFLADFFAACRGEVERIPCGEDGLPGIIAQASQQTKLKMNEIGARVESVVAIAIVLGGMDAPEPDHVINRPFLIWFERDGLSRPLFAGHITPDDWRNPGNI